MLDTNDPTGLRARVRDLASRDHSSPGEPFRPSNGTDGDLFESRFCERCERDRDSRLALEAGEDPSGGCLILCNALFFDLSDPQFPKEWIYDGDGRGTCTAFEVAKPRPGEDGYEEPRYVSTDPGQGALFYGGVTLPDEIPVPVEADLIPAILAEIEANPFDGAGTREEADRLRAVLVRMKRSDGRRLHPYRYVEVWSAYGVRHLLRKILRETAGVEVPFAPGLVALHYLRPEDL